MTATAIPAQTVSDRGQTGRDIALMRLVTAGDVDAFAELYDVMAPQVYGLIRRAGLPHLHREAIMLAYYQGYTDSQVADILDADLPAIKSGIRAGLQHLHTGLGYATLTRPPSVA